MGKAEDNTNVRKAITGRMAAEKKKAIIAISLILVMAVLWIKNFTKKDSVQDAQALSLTQQNADELSREMKFSYTQLPQIQGRHNVLTRDIFASNNWKGFRREGQLADDYWSAQTLTGIGNEAGDIIENAVKEMTLGAIVPEPDRQAFIENKLLSLGQKFIFKYKHNSYEFKVLKIHEDKVELECEGTVVIKKMKRPQQED